MAASSRQDRQRTGAYTFLTLGLCVVALLPAAAVRAQAPSGFTNMGPFRSDAESFEYAQRMGARYENVPSSVYFQYAPSTRGPANAANGNGDGACPSAMAASTLQNGARPPMFTPQRPLMQNFPTMIELLRGQPRFSKLATLLELAPGFVAQIRDGGPYTVFAPTNDALGRMPNGALEWLIANPPLLVRFIQTHVIRGMAVFAENFHDEDRFVSMDGSVHYITQDASGNLEIDEAARLFESKKDEVAATGVIHGIGNVLIPSGMAWPSGLPRCKNNCVQLNRPAFVMPLCVRRCIEGYQDY